MEFIALTIFFIVLILIIFHRLNRATAAILGSVLMIMLGIFPQQLEAFKECIDFNTIFLLLGMMIFVSVVKKSGFFTFIGIKTLKYTGKNGYLLFFSLTFLVALISAFVDNVTTILIFIPITFAITDSLEIDYIPYILGEIFASNIGGTATIIGDPPNIMIASAAGMDFMKFSSVMAPIAAVNMIFMQLLFFLLFKKDLSMKFNQEVISNFDTNKIITDKRKFYISAGLFIGVVLMFVFQRFIGAESSVLGLLAGFMALLLLEPLEITETLKEVEWESLLFFIGLFIITGGLERTGVLSDFAKILVNTAGNSAQFFATFLLAVSALFSGFIDNIPFAATMLPIIKNLPHINPVVFKDLDPQWYALALGVCLGGNMTPIGASANIVGLAMVKQFKNMLVSFAKFTFYGTILVIGNVIISVILLNLLLFR